ncbi:MAG: DNA ligase D [Flavobacteriales bacterium]
MGLEHYRAKRDLKKTPEPAGGKANKGAPLIFVVQRHKASHLHYDFRLEMRGVLKSWAVPKGPSLDPSDKRLAMMVEDHPYDYKDFKGVIPEENYGAGIVEIWDHGTYAPLDLPEGKDPETYLMSQLHKGSIKIRMKGRKLKGEFALVRMHTKEQNSWLLIKHNDRFAKKGYDSEKDTLKSSPINKALASERKDGKPRRTKKAKLPDATPEGADAKKGHAVKAKEVERVSSSATPTKKHFSVRGLSKAAKVKDPVQPMLASPDTAAFDDPEWLFEIKWDGYRAIAETGGKSVRLYSRNGLSFAEGYPSITDDLRTIQRNMVLDGELVAMNDAGRPDFQLLQHAAAVPDTQLVYQVFDLLSLNGQDTTSLSLIERKELLRKALPDLEHIKYCDHVLSRGKDFFAAAQEQDLEGVIAKRKDSIYQPGVRSKSWLKVKNHHAQEVVIGGYTAPRNSRKHFGALLLGVYEKDKLRYVGHTGTGFDARTLKELSSTMKPLERKTSPFADKVDANGPATWVSPILVANIKFTEWTRDGHMRHPVFLGLRTDKDPQDVHKEKVVAHTSGTGKKKKAVSPKKPKSAVVNENKARERIVKDGRHSVQLTNLDKVFWPKEGYTKGDVLAYYERIAPLLLPHLKDRPESLYRTPNGIKGPGFFQKDAGGNAPSWVPSVKIASDSRGGADIDYILCNDLGTLLYLVNLGCIELNPWTSRKQHLLKPDHIVMDLDPSKGNTFDEVVKAALAVKVILDRIGIAGYCKTSGSTGIHVYIPTGGKYTFEQLAPVAKNIMRVVNGMLPKTTTLERSLAKRNKKQIYLDHLQNRKGQTLASVYSIRPKPGATVSTPLDWDEVRPGLDLREFTIHTVPTRVEKVGDLFQGVLGKASFPLTKVARVLEDLLVDEDA